MALMLSDPLVASICASLAVSAAVLICLIVCSFTRRPAQSVLLSIVVPPIAMPVDGVRPTLLVLAGGMAGVDGSRMGRDVGPMLRVVSGAN